MSDWIKSQFQRSFQGSYEKTQIIIAKGDGIFEDISAEAVLFLHGSVGYVVVGGKRLDLPELELPLMISGCVENNGDEDRVGVLTIQPGSVNNVMIRCNPIVIGDDIPGE